MSARQGKWERDRQAPVAVVQKHRHIKERVQGGKRNMAAAKSERLPLTLRWTRRQKREPHEMVSISWGSNRIF